MSITETELQAPNQQGLEIKPTPRGEMIVSPLDSFR